MKESKILISILIPTYNRREYLEECINSVEEQKGFQKNEIEILIGDNSEGNETKEFMNEFFKLNHKYIIKYIKNKKNMGSTRNINNLLDLSKGVYYIILSDDDKFYDENSLRVIYNGLLKYNLDACYGKYRVINGEGKDQGDFGLHTKIGKNKIYYDSFEEQIKGHSICFGGVLYKNFGFRYDYGSKWFGDWTMNLQYLYHKKQIAMINAYTFSYREHTTNDTKSVPKTFWWKHLFYLFRFFSIPWQIRIKYLFDIVMRGLKYRVGRIKSIIKNMISSDKKNKYSTD